MKYAVEVSVTMSTLVHVEADEPSEARELAEGLVTIDDFKDCELYVETSNCYEDEEVTA
jgi:hypothetical protein